MNRTQIEWVVNPDGSRPGWSWNPVTGCLNNCEYCYARKLANGRLKPLYLANKNVASVAPLPDGGKCSPVNMRADITLIESHRADPFYPRFWEDRLDELKPKKGMRFFPMRNPKGIFVCDMGDLFGIGVPEEWTRKVLDVIGRNFLSADRFYILTKQAQRLPDFSPFPDNAWVGVTATNTDMLFDAVNCLEGVEAKVKYISLEPLLAWADTSQWDYPLSDSLKGINWLIIGACTGTWAEMDRLERKFTPLFPYTLMQWGNKWTLQPKIEWVREIVEAADKAGVKVFLKDNLSPLLRGHPIPKKDMWAYRFEQGVLNLRQELPE